MFVAKLLKAFPELRLSEGYRELIDERITEFVEIDFSGKESFCGKATQAKYALTQMANEPEFWDTVSEGFPHSPLSAATGFLKDLRQKAQNAKRKPEEREALIDAETTLRLCIVHLTAWKLRLQLLAYFEAIEQENALHERAVAETVARSADSYLRRCRLGQERRNSTLPNTLQAVIPQITSDKRTKLLKNAARTVELLATF